MSLAVAPMAPYGETLLSEEGKRQIEWYITGLCRPSSAVSEDSTTDGQNTASNETLWTVGNTALNAFLQSNVTGPVLEKAAEIEAIFVQTYKEKVGQNRLSGNIQRKLRKLCLRSLDVDGVSPYPYIPRIELFCLAKAIFTSPGITDPPITGDHPKVSKEWMELRLNVWHYKLLTQPSLGPSANFNKSAQWSDVPSLAGLILDSIGQVRSQLIGEEVWADNNKWNQEHKTEFLVESANYYIMLGRDDIAKQLLKEAAELHGFVYALSGALGKRTRYQEKSTSQLVVLAKSGVDREEVDSGLNEDRPKPGPKTLPDALELNDDTLLENIEFNKTTNGASEDAAKKSILPPELVELAPEDQPQLSPLDHIILLTEATLKDSFSPADSLTLEEVLPYAVRVISDKSTNWQIYTHALLVRSRIEVHRSRTVERGVLQMQAVVDQVVVDTSTRVTSGPEPQPEKADSSDIPVIAVTCHDDKTSTITTPTNEPPKVTSFFPAPKPDEYSPAHVRLQYIHSLSSPPRWHLESELAYAWTGVGSLISALEIFKRLKMWAEVALCYASSAAAGDEDGRGSGGEEKGRTIVRWQLFHRTGESADEEADPDSQDYDQDIAVLKATDFSGPERSPAPPNAPRLFCILGDFDNEPTYYEKAWEVSNRRYARAQKSLGEHYLQQKAWDKALEAYKLAVAVNRLSPDLWSRLGDINLRLGNFADASEAFGRAIGAAGDVIGGEDARTWSNLGSSLWSMYLEAVDELKKKEQEKKTAADDEETAEREEVDEKDVSSTEPKKRDPSTLLNQSLAAYKRGASIAHDNWRIWDNVLTLASRVHPPAISEMIQAIRSIIRIRNTEDALDDDVLRLLLQEAVLSKSKSDDGTGKYEPRRGTPERNVCELFETDIARLITNRSELWELICRERVWRRDYAGAVDAAEKAWRAAVGSAGGGLLPSAGSEPEGRNWLLNKDAWKTVVKRTDELVSVLENWGPEVENLGSKWRGKARNAVRSVMSRGKESWEGSEEWTELDHLLEGLKI
jgi:tetratricopeptide (TPR) repeat protein